MYVSDALALRRAWRPRPRPECFADRRVDACPANCAAAAYAYKNDEDKFAMARKESYLLTLAAGLNGSSDPEALTLVALLTRASL